MTIDIEKLARDSGAYSTDTAKEVYLQNDEYIFIKNSLINFAEAYATKVLEDKEREIAEIKQMYRGAKILLDFNTQKNPLLKEIAELQAHINALREALHLVNEHSKLWGFKIAGNVQTEIDAALSATQAESLQAFENDVLERAAKVCDEKCLQLEKKAGEYLEDGEWDEVNNQRAIAWIVSVVATSIRALKGK